MNRNYYAITFSYGKECPHVFFDVNICVRNKTGGYNVYENVRAMLDTGATISAISKKIVAGLDLPSRENGDFTTAERERYIAPIYYVDVIFHQNYRFRNLKVIEIGDSNMCDFLIGMDIIRMGDMAITNAGGNMVFSFRIPPAEKHIDYEYEMLKISNPGEKIEPLLF